MKALILKDLYFLKSNLAFYLLTMVIFLTVELTGGSWGMTAIWASTIPCTIYITDERTCWLTVCGTLPVERKTIVAEKYLFALGEFIGTLKNAEALDVLPYHTMGVDKYKKLGMEYPLEGVEAMDKKKALECKRIILKGIEKARGLK